MKRFSRVLLFSGLALLTALGLRMAFLGTEIALNPAEPTLPAGTTRVTCRLVNPTLRSVGYSEPFYLECRAGDSWQRISEKHDNVAFQLPLYTLGPLGSETLEFSLSLYSDMNRPGIYRIVLPVTIQEETQNLYCQFTVE